MSHFLCPICKSPLCEEQNGVACALNHRFDRAKEGYFYLLSKHSKDPGDNKEMVSARRDFLDKGYYTPLANEIANIINEHCKHSITLLDAGVGTGFYLADIIEQRQDFDDTYLGVDISKHAVKIASKRHKTAKCAVASVFDLPIASESIDVLVCVFSPFAMQEYTRVLKKNGILIIAYPCDNHLIELRKALYENVRPNATILPKSELAIVDEKELTFGFSLTSSTDISNLLTMTPYVYRAPKEAVERLKAQNQLSLTADFHISTLKKL